MKIHLEGEEGLGIKRHKEINEFMPVPLTHEHEQVSIGEA